MVRSNMYEPNIPQPFNLMKTTKMMDFCLIIKKN